MRLSTASLYCTNGAEKWSSWCTIGAFKASASLFVRVDFPQPDAPVTRMTNLSLDFLRVDKFLAYRRSRLVSATAAMAIDGNITNNTKELYRAILLAEEPICSLRCSAIKNLQMGLRPYFSKFKCLRDCTAFNAFDIFTQHNLHVWITIQSNNNYMHRDLIIPPTDLQCTVWYMLLSCASNDFPDDRVQSD